MTRKWNVWAPLPLRLILGLALLVHGFPKLFAEGHASFVAMLQGMGIPAAELTAWGVGLFEVFGGLALLAGAFTAMIATLGIIEMVVAAALVHLPHGFSFLNITGMTESGPVFGMPGYEVNLLYIAGFLTLVLGGAGAWSVDERRGVEAPATVHPRPRPLSERRVPDRAWTGVPVGPRAGASEREPASSRR